jgi:branched-chain amino acid transport system substrate-binding protein
VTYAHRFWARSFALGAAIALIACEGEQPIVLGIAGPLSEPRGTSMRLAAQLAIREINARGGVRGRELRLEFGDDSARTDAAVRVARRFYDEDALVAVVGHLTSSTTLAGASVYNSGDRRVPEISPSASSPEITSAGPYTFRICPSDLKHGTALADWAVSTLGGRRAAVLYENDTYGRGVRQTFTQRFSEQGGSIVAAFPYLAELPDFEPYLRLVQVRGGADILFIAGTAATAERIIQTGRRMGLRSRVLGGDALSGIQQSSKIADGVFVSSAYLADRDGERNATFVAAYRRAYENQVPDHRGAGTYDIIYMLADAVRAAGADRTAIRDYLLSIGTSREAFEGVTGTIAFDEHGDVPSKDVLIGVVSNGTLLTAER